MGSFVVNIVHVQRIVTNYVHFFVYVPYVNTNYAFMRCISSLSLSIINHFYMLLGT